MLGEIQYELIILKDQSGNLNHPPLLFLFTVAVAILLTISMANLLVGLAVGDIEGIITALLEKHVLYLSHLKRSPLIWRFYKPYIVAYPNRRSLLLAQTWQCLRNIAMDKEDTEELITGTSLITINPDHNDNQCEEMGQQLEELILG